MELEEGRSDAADPREPGVQRLQQAEGGETAGSGPPAPHRAFFSANLVFSHFLYRPLACGATAMRTSSTITTT